MTMMRAAVAREFGAPLTIEELPVPRPGPGEVLVKIEATGVCHTDLHAVDGDWPVKPALPLIQNPLYSCNMPLLYRTSEGKQPRAPSPKTSVWEFEWAASLGKLIHA